MRPIRHDDYEEMAATFQCLQIKILNEVLKRHGIDEAKQRQEICGDYIFAVGEFLDQHWFENEGRRLHPLLCFSEKFLNSDTDPTDLGDVFSSVRDVLVSRICFWQHFVLLRGQRRDDSGFADWRGRRGQLSTGCS